MFADPSDKIYGVFNQIRYFIGLAASVVTVSGICNLVGGGVLWTCHCGGGGKYQSVSRLALLIENRWMSRRDQIRSRLSWNALIAHGTHTTVWVR